MRRGFVLALSTVGGVGALPGLDRPGEVGQPPPGPGQPVGPAAVSLPARSASKAARAAAHSAARSASHPVCDVAEPAMAPIIASPAPAHHGPIGGQRRAFMPVRSGVPRSRPHPPRTPRRPQVDGRSSEPGHALDPGCTLPGQPGDGSHPCSFLGPSARSRPCSPRPGSPPTPRAASPASSTCTWPKHPSLLANLDESNGNTLLLTAHAHASAPGALPTRRLAALHGSGTGLSAGAAAGLLAWRCCWSPAAGPAGPPPDLVRVGSGQAELLEPPEAVLQ